MNNKQYNIELLISYYQGLIDINDAFTKLNSDKENDRYKHLVSQLIIIRQTIMSKDLAGINALYKPIWELFVTNEHFSILEEAIEFYKRNPNVSYNATEAKQYLDNHLTKPVTVNVTDMQKLIKHIEQGIATSVNTALTQSSSDFNEVIKKSSNDTLAALTTSNALMKSDIIKYDALLTEHISKSAIIFTEVIEKEHARFVQKIASDSNAIIAGISEVNANELAAQTELVKQSMKDFEDKSFKQFCISFILVVGALFACSILSSTWAANKLVSNAIALKKSAASNPHIQATPQKPRHH